MNLKEVNFTNSYTGEYKTAPIGFSWTTLFFGFVPAMFRSDWKWAGIQLGLALLTGGLSVFVMPFLYNKLHIKDLLNKGFLPVDENQENIIVSKGIISKHELDFMKNRSK